MEQWQICLIIFSCPKKIEKNGMIISWKFSKDKVDFEMFAPTRGWIAIGLNEENKLIGNNLIMGKIENNQPMISDRFITQFGQHKAVEKLNGNNHLSNIKGTSTKKGSTIKFSIAQKTMDKFHYNLKQKKTMYLLIAYSTSPDFSHHSIMRTSIEVIL